MRGTSPEPLTHERRSLRHSAFCILHSAFHLEASGLLSRAGRAGALAAALGRHARYSFLPPGRRSEPPLRVGMDASAAQIAEPSGMGRYVDLLIRGLLSAGSGDAYTLLCSDGPVPDGWRGARVRRLRFPVALLGRLAGRPAIEVATGPVDVFHCQVGFTPRFRYGALVATIHDVIPLRVPEGYDAAYLDGLRAHLDDLAAQATLIHTVSHAAARDLEAVLGIAPERIRVVPHGPDPRCQHSPAAKERVAMRMGLGLAGSYALALGTVSRHKNHAALARAFANVAREVPHLLVIAGRRGSASEELAATVAGLETGDRVRVLGYVPDRFIPALIAEADLLLQPSLLEGFGMPVLDAMAAGTPVACANVPALPEVAGDAAEFFDPLDVDSIAGALARTLGDPGRREALRAAGRARAAEFSWERTARLTSDVYHEAARIHASG